MTFVSKKEADAYDKMLDLADELALLLERSPLTLSSGQQEELALFLAQRRDTLNHLLKGGTLGELERKAGDEESSTAE